MKNILFFTLLLSIASCTKSHEHEGKTAPTISISSPTEGQEFISGAAILIKGTAADDAGLHEGTIVIVKSGDNAELFRKEPSVHDLLTYAIDYTFTPIVTTATDMKIIATFYDHDDNKTEKVINLKVKP
ncbi:MAG: hypothetical protein ACOYOA_15150 [Saprospiraceae bacterium]